MIVQGEKTQLYIAIYNNKEIKRIKTRIIVTAWSYIKVERYD